MQRMTRSKNLHGPWGLYAIIDPEHCLGRPLLSLARMVLENGAGALQLRDKRGTFEEILSAARSLQALCDEYGVPFIINDNPYLAREAGADGVHLGQEDIPVALAREIIGPDRLIGLSTHTREQALSGETSGADYLGFGPAFATATKVQPYLPLGLEFMQWAAQSLRVPFVAIGGITPQNARELASVGVSNIAVISALGESDDPGWMAQAFVQAVKRI